MSDKKQPEKLNLSYYRHPAIRLRGATTLGKLAPLLWLLLVVSPAVGGQDAPDYRSRTIYFLLTDRFHPHQPYDPYVDPLFPDATN